MLPDLPGPYAALARSRGRRLAVVLAVLACCAGITTAQTTGRLYFLGVTSTMQSASDSRVDAEWLASADFVFTMQRPAWNLVAYVEGSTTPGTNGVATLLPESNGDAGSALDGDGQGRLQISELKFGFALPRSAKVTVGLLDPTAYLDVSRVAGDENTQFLAVSLVQNPVIDFPDYTLGVVYEQPMSGHPWLFRTALTGSNGIADNPGASYRELVRIADDGKSFFLGGSASRVRNRWLFRLGAWWNASDHAALDGSNQDPDSYGLYLVDGHLWGRHSLNLRLGFARPEVSKAAGLAASAYRYRSDRATAGVGVSYTWVSPEGRQPDEANTRMVESFFRWRFGKGFFVTPSVQHLTNSRFDASGDLTDRAVFIANLRLTYLFERAAGTSRNRAGFANGCEVTGFSVSWCG